MSLSINTNTISANAQRNLGTTTSSLGASMQRLSSGLRVNSAKDDAAGLAISERLRSQVSGFTIASRNVNDGISLAQTAEGALGKIGDMLQRMRELAVQSANSTNSTADRSALQSEVSQLRDEIDRVAKTTTFNNQKILNGSFAGAVFQVGSNAGDNISVGALTDATATGLASVRYAEATQTGLAASGVTSLGAIATGQLSISISGGQSYSLGSIEAASSGDERLGQVVEAINRKTADTGVTAYLVKGNDGNFSVSLLSSALDSSGAAASVSLAGAGWSATATGVTATSLTATTATGIDTLAVSTQSNSWVALKKLDAAIDQVNSARGKLGALQSRFESASSNIGIMLENNSSSRGRIIDADFAKETANLSRSQILQQAGTAMVAQANQLPQGVLALLR
jgi:flagellin